MKTFLRFIFLTVLLMGQMVSAQEEIPLIPVGEVIEAQMTEGDLTAQYRFEAQVGDILEITAGDGNAGIRELILTDETGQEISRDSYGNMSGNVSLESRTFTVSGTYYLTLRASEAVPYTIFIDKRETPLLDSNTGYREWMSEQVVELDYIFQGTAGEVIWATAISEYIDPYLRVIDPDGIEIAADDDSSGNLNALVDDLELSKTGEYRLIVNSYGEQREGQVAVQVSLNSTPDPNAIPPDIRTLQMELTEENPEDAVSFQGLIGEAIYINVDAPRGIEVELQINGYDMALQNNLTDDVFLNEVVLPTTGLYYITVSQGDVPVYGAVTVMIERIGMNFLPLYQSLTARLSSKNQTAHFYVYGYSGGYGRFKLSQQVRWGYLTEPFRVTMRQEGEIIAAYTMDAVTNLSEVENQVNFITNDGLIDVEVELMGDGPAWFVVEGDIAYGEG